MHYFVISAIVFGILILFTPGIFADYSTVELVGVSLLALPTGIAGIVIGFIISVLAFVTLIFIFKGAGIIISELIKVFKQIGK